MVSPSLEDGRKTMGSFFISFHFLLFVVVSCNKVFPVQVGEGKTVGKMPKWNVVICHWLSFSKQQIPVFAHL
jgi:hypothetical protein